MESCYYELSNIKLNLNILETGLFNIFILILILTNLKKRKIEDKLKNRKIIIIKTIHTVENQLIYALKCFEEKKIKLNQLNIIDNKIKCETNFFKKKLLISNINQLEYNLKNLFNISLSNFYLKKKKN